MNTTKLLEIAEDLSIDSLKEELEHLQQKEKSSDVPLLLPLVGEFSAGKTTLLNALMDTAVLETGIEPTTATIYKIHFGCNSASCEICYSNGDMKTKKDLSTLTNALLSDASIVNLFDTSKRVPSSLILVDTPGISSSNNKHRQTLVDFLPKADGLLIVMDINQQLTASLSNFLKITGILKCPMFLVLTFCDTKPKSEIEKIRENISKTTEIPFKEIVCVSAKNNGVEELQLLFETIQRDKHSILRSSIENRCEVISHRMCETIDALLEERPDYSDESRLINEKERTLRHLRREIDRLFDNIASNIDHVRRTNIGEFEDQLSVKLETAMTSPSNDYDTEIKSVVAAVTSIVGSKFGDEVQRLISQSTISLKYIFAGPIIVDYDTNNSPIFDSMGHKYDKLILTGIKTAVDAAASILGTSKSDTDNETPVAQLSKSISQSSETGLLDSLVWLLTDNTSGKPQRRRAIHDVIDGQLVPKYKIAINKEISRLENEIKEAILNSYSQSIEELEIAVKRLKEEQSNNIEEHKRLVKKLKSYKQELTRNN